MLSFLPEAREGLRRAMERQILNFKEDDMIDNLSANRRDLLIAPLLAAMPAALLGGRADASPVDPAMTFTKLPEQITWEKARNRPPKTVEQALLWSKSSVGTGSGGSSPTRSH